MAEPARKRATYDDLYNIPENMTGEIIDGQLYATPRPSRKHVRTVYSLGYVIGRSYDFDERGGPGGWIFLPESEIQLDGDTFVPDLAGWRKERFPAEEDHNWISVAPDWVCEILSPSSIRHDRITKIGTYAKHRIPYFWLVDPVAKILEVFKLESGRWTVAGAYAENEKVRAEPFQEIEIDLANLWLEGKPKRSEQ